MAIQANKQPEHPPEGLGELASDAVEQMQRLVRAEITLARQELRREAKLATVPVAALVGGVLLMETALIVWAQACILWANSVAWITALIGVGFAMLAALSAYVGVALLVRPHLVHTRARLEEIKQSLTEASHGET